MQALRSSLRIAAAITVLTAAATTAQAIVIRHDVDDTRYIEFAEKVPTPVVLFRTAEGSANGMGTWIADNWIITAAHVGEDIVHGDRIGPDQALLVEEVVLHPEWPDMPIDVALVRLAAPEASSDQVSICDASEKMNPTVFVVGAGDAGTGKSGPTVFDGKLRAAENAIHSLDENFLTFVFDAPESTDALALEGVSGPGDSGGPAYLKTDDGFCLLAVSLGQDTENTDGVEGVYGVVEYYSRVDVLRDWISDALSSKKPEHMK